MARIENKGNYIKVIRTDKDIRLYLKTDVLPDVQNNKFVIINKAKNNVLESFNFTEVTAPESNSNDQLFDAVYTFIVGTTATGTLDSFTDYISIDRTLANSATIGITSTMYFNYLLFDDTIVEEARIGILVPDDFDNTYDPEIRFKVAPAANQDTISSQTFKFQGDFKYIGKDESGKKADDETKTVVVSVSTLYKTVTDAKLVLTGSKISPGDIVGMKFSRLATDPQDSRNQDAEISSITFHYRSV